MVCGRQSRGYQRHNVFKLAQVNAVIRRKQHKRFVHLRHWLREKRLGVEYHIEYRLLLAAPKLPHSV
jgi:hypothetical protein